MPSSAPPSGETTPVISSPPLQPRHRLNTSTTHRSIEIDNSAVTIDHDSVEDGDDIQNSDGTRIIGAQEQQHEDTDQTIPSKETPESGTITSQPKSSSIKETKQSTPSLSISVPRATLRNAVDNGLYHRPFLTRLLSLHKRVRVEGRRDDRADSIFYAPFSEEASSNLSNAPSPSSSKPFSKTQLIPVNPKRDDMTHVVHASHDFEILFMGMLSPPKDGFATDGNELLLYSLKNEMYPDEKSEEDTNPESETGNEIEPTSQKTIPDNDSTTGDKNRSGKEQKKKRSNISSSTTTEARERDESEEEEEDEEIVGKSSSKEKSKKSTEKQKDSLKNTQLRDPNGIALQPTDDPIIHYDPIIDGRGMGSTPDTFIPIPASKSTFRRHFGSNSSIYRIPLRFCVMEIDKTSPTQAKAIEQLTNLTVPQTSLITQIAPYSNLISSAVNVLNTITKSEVKKYARPDNVLYKDVEFFLYNSKKPVFDYATNYLKYGYYFFLSKPVDAQLYAQTDSSSQNIRLLLRRLKLTIANRTNGEKNYFPLTGVAYVVVKVKPGCSHVSKGRSTAIIQDHRSRLEHILHANNALGLLSDMK